MTRPRTNRSGYTVPWVVDWDQGRTVAHDLGLDPDQIHGEDLAALGRAVNEHHEANLPIGDPAEPISQELDQALDQIAANREAQAPTSARPHPVTTPEVPSMVDSGPTRRARPSQRRVRSRRSDVLLEKNDPDEEMWT